MAKNKSKYIHNYNKYKRTALTSLWQNMSDWENIQFIQKHLNYKDKYKLKIKRWKKIGVY